MVLPGTMIRPLEVIILAVIIQEGIVLAVTIHQVIPAVILVAIQAEEVEVEDAIQEEVVEVAEMEAEEGVKRIKMKIINQEESKEHLLPYQLCYSFPVFVLSLTNNLTTSELPGCNFSKIHTFVFPKG